MNQEWMLHGFDGLLGQASKIDPSKIAEEFAPVLAAGERVQPGIPPRD